MTVAASASPAIIDAEVGGPVVNLLGHRQNSVDLSRLGPGRDHFPRFTSRFPILLLAYLPSETTWWGNREGRVVDRGPVDRLRQVVASDPLSDLLDLRCARPSEAQSPETASGDVVLNLALSYKPLELGQGGAGSVPWKPPIAIRGSPVATW